MGTGISCSLTWTFGLHLLSRILLVAVTLLCVAMVAFWAKHRNPGFTTQAMPAWGMVSMGLLAVGSAYSGTLGWWPVHAAMWAIGTPLGFITCLWYLAAMLRKEVGSSAFTWGLPLVAPMVAATSSAQLAAHLDNRLIMIIGAAGFFLALLVALPTFGVVYWELARRGRNTNHPGLGYLPQEVATTVWIPLGIVGQSTAAAQLLTHGGIATYKTGALAHAGTTYGTIMLLIGVPFALFAVAHHWSSVGHYIVAKDRLPMPYNPSWWASTFPVGTMCLGAHYLAATTDVPLLDTISHCLLFLLLLHLAWAALGGAAVIFRRR